MKHTKEYMAEYREKHRERIRELQKKYNKTYYERHKEQESARCKKYRAENREKVREMQRNWREKNKDYWKNYDKNGYGKYRYEHRVKMGYWAAQQRTQRLINRLWIRPSTCSICGNGWKIEAHHPDYNKRNEIIFCCVSCHQLIHNGIIPQPKPIILDIN